MNIEKALKNKKEQLESLETPATMEKCLRTALDKKSLRFPVKAAVVLLALLLFFSYSFDSLAYYGQRLVGHRGIMAESLKDLTDEGFGQEIGKTCVFGNGLKFTLEGLIFDENELIVFYRLYKPGEKLEFPGPQLEIKGLKPFGYSQRSGNGRQIDDNTIIFIQSFEPPAFYEKWMSMTVRIVINGRLEERKLPFTLDRNKAVKRTYKANLKKEASIAGYNIIFRNITATAMSTSVTGEINRDSQLANDGKVTEESLPPGIVFDIVPDGGTPITFYGGVTTSGDRWGFENSGEGIQRGTGKLLITDLRFEEFSQIDRKLEVKPGSSNLQVKEDLVVKSIRTNGETTSVTVSSKGVPVFGLFINGRQLESINADSFDRDTRSEEMVDRTYGFKGTGKVMELAVKGIKYIEYSKEKLEIQIR